MARIHLCQVAATMPPAAGGRKSGPGLNAAPGSYIL